MSDLSSFYNENLFSVNGKTAIITGGATGVGKGMATALAMNGAKVIICGRRGDVTEATAQELSKASQSRGGSVIAIQADVSTKPGVIEFYDKCKEHTDVVDLLVNNAGFSSNWIDQSSLANLDTLQQKLMSIPDNAWSNMTAIHVAGPYYLSAQFLPMFAKSNNPSVVNITSLASLFLDRSVCEYSYAQSKAAESHLTRLLAASLQVAGVRVNAIMPGLFKSQLTVNPESGELWPPMQEALKRIPGGRAGTHEEIGGPLIMFASAAGAYCNGTEITIDAGWLLNSSARDV